MKRQTFFLTILLILSFAIPHAAHADVAPPETVPGSNLNPGVESTQVRMVAETVTLTVSQDPADENGAVAKTEAVFTMRNLGTAEEKMNVRFPLSFFNGNSDGFGGFPEIESIAVKVNGKTVPTRREVQPFLNNTSFYQERDEIPWSIFEVTFPPNQDVIIEVVYTVEGFGYYPYEVFKYILETGAGWNGTIGSAEVILRLPYEANEKNVWVEGVEGYGDATPGGVFSGNEVHWKFTDLEPTFENNLQFVVVAPSVWKKVLTETENAARNPNDGEAWGRLGKAYKEIITMSHGNLRADSAGQEMRELSRSAYEKCLALLPNDPLWRYGYADLLWSNYYFDVYLYSKTDTEGILPTALLNLQTALELDPNLQQAKDLLDEISYAVPEAVQPNDDGSYILLGLTATPIPPTPYGGFATETPPRSTLEPASTPQARSTPTEAPEPAATNPLCSSAAIFPILFGLLLIPKRRAAK
ncbi:MAG: hypothetical protein HYZ22_04545 [Chloroflexi bacterium]|nr:hypothetical protein [Chloroflexota bacterium]